MSLCPESLTGPVLIHSHPPALFRAFSCLLCAQCDQHDPECGRRTSHGQVVRVSQGALQLMIDRCSKGLKPHYLKIAEIARLAVVNFIDETTWRIFGPPGKRKFWLWVMGSSHVVFIRIHARRSKKAFHELIQGWTGYLVSDAYNVYKLWEPYMHQSCLAHLIRRARKLSEDPDPEIAKGGKALHKELQRLVSFDRATLLEGEWLTWNMRMKKVLKRYQDRPDSLGTFCSRLNSGYVCLYTFLRTIGVEATNNRAERNIRPSVAKRKNNLGSTSEFGLGWTERSQSVVQTCRLHGWSFYDLLSDAVACTFRHEQPDLSRYDALAAKCLEERKALGLA